MCGIHIVTSFYKIYYEKLKIIMLIIIIIIKNHFTMEKPDKHYLSKMIGLIPRLINHVDSIYPLYDIMKMAVYLCI
jgi:hypothetical protein